RDDVQHEADLLPARRADPVAGQQQLERVLHRDTAWETDRADDRRHTELDLREPELGPFAREDEVARGDRGEAVAEAVAVDRRDRRLPQLETALERVDRRDLPERPRPRARGTGAVVEVGARAERAAGAGDD